MSNESRFENAAVCYARVSTEEQVRGGVSLDAPEERLQMYCNSNRLDVVGVVIEPGVSGAKSLSSRLGGAGIAGLPTIQVSARSIGQ